MLKWEEIAQDTWRLKVFGGWIVSRTIENHNGVTTALCFVPDANHEWEVML